MSETIIINTKKLLQKATDFLKQRKLKSTDIESSTLSPYDKHVKPEVGIVGFAESEECAFIYPIHSRVGMKIEFSPEEALEAVAELWEDPDCKYILHFGKHDYKYMAVLEGIWLQGFMQHRTGYSYDSGHESYCLKGEPIGHKLKDIAWELGIGGYERELEKYKQTHPEAKTNYNLIPLSILGPYCGMDCIVSFKAHHIFRPRLEKQGLWKNPFLFPQMYHNWTAAMLEIKGIKMNLRRNRELKPIFQNLLSKQEKKLCHFKSVKKLLEWRKAKAKDKIRERVLSYKRPVAKPNRLIKVRLREWLEKNPFKWTTEERRHLLFEILKYPVLARTNKTQQPICAKKVIKKLLLLKRNHTVLQCMQRRNVYAYGLSNLINPVPNWEGTDGRTHTTYNPAGMKTGRVPSQNPNHENIPKHDPEIAPLLRSQFVPTDENYVFVAADEKQMELRLVADAAQEETMIEELNAGKDPHKMGAAAFYEIPEEQVTKEQRKDAKSAVSFGIIYGRTDEPLAADFGQPVEWATEKKRNYFRKYCRIPEWWEKVEHFAKKHGYVLSNFGNISYVPGIFSDETGVYNKAKRDAINHPIQTDGSHVTWTAAYRMMRFLMKYKFKSNAVHRRERFLFYYKSRPVVVIHDDITGDVYRPELQDYIEHLYRYMTDREYIHKKTGWMCSVKWDIDISICNKHLGQSIELARNGDEFIIPKELK